MEKIILFTEATLENCRQKKELRLKLQKRASKFDKITLPSNVDGLCGYHRLCYKYFCSITEKRQKACKYFDNFYVLISETNLIIFNKQVTKLRLVDKRAEQTFRKYQMVIFSKNFRKIAQKILQ